MIDCLISCRTHFGFLPLFRNCFFASNFLLFIDCEVFLSCSSTRQYRGKKLLRKQWEQGGRPSRDGFPGLCGGWGFLEKVKLSFILKVECKIAINKERSSLIFVWFPIELNTPTDNQTTYLRSSKVLRMITTATRLIRK